MQSSLTPDELFAEVLLQRSYGHTVILVEGPDDVRTLEPHIDQTSGVMLPGLGKTAVEYALNCANGQRMRRVVAILDRDWVGILPSATPIYNAIYTDEYDLDATILAISNICERVISAHSDGDLRRAHLTGLGVTRALDAVVMCVAAIGILRLVCETNALGLTTRNLPVEPIYDRATGKASIDLLVQISLAKTKPKPSVAGADIITQVEDLMAKTANHYMYCSGHDLANALSNAVRKFWGGSVGADFLIKAVRGSLSPGELRSTDLYRKVADWAAKNRTVVWL